MMNIFDGNGKKDLFEGYWKAKDGDFILKIEKDDKGIYSGYSVWLKNPTFPKGDKDEGKIQNDRNNPDSKLKDRLVLGLQIVGELKIDGDNLKDGWVYDSWRGKMYHGSAELEDENILKLKSSIDKSGSFTYTTKAYRVRTSDYQKYGLEN